jgi:hypothetical protein
MNDSPDEAERGVKTLLPTLIVGAAGFGITDVTPSTTRKDAEDASDSVVPETVMAGAPGASVCPETMKVGPGLLLFWLLEFSDLSWVACAVIVELPMTNCGGLLGTDNDPGRA